MLEAWQVLWKEDGKVPLLVACFFGRRQDYNLRKEHVVFVVKGKS